MDGQITDSHLDEITRGHCECWRLMPPYLDLPSTIVSNIERSHSDEEGRRTEFFKLWKEANGAKATYKCLINALLMVQWKCYEDAGSIWKLLLRDSAIQQLKEGMLLC